MLYNDGSVGERDLNMSEVVPGPWRGKHPPNISDFSQTHIHTHTDKQTLSLTHPPTNPPAQAHTHTSIQTHAQTDSRAYRHTHTYTLTHRHTPTHYPAHRHKQTLTHPPTQPPTRPGIHTHTHTHTHHIRENRPTLPGRHPPIQTHSPTPMDLILGGEYIIKLRTD